MCIRDRTYTERLADKTAWKRSSLGEDEKLFPAFCLCFLSRLALPFEIEEILCLYSSSSEALNFGEKTFYCKAFLVPELLAFSIPLHLVACVFFFLSDWKHCWKAGLRW